MIDYDNLKKIIECQKNINKMIEEIMPEYYKSREELAVPKPKYEIRNFVWMLDEGNRPSHKKILDYRWDDYCKGYVYEITDSIGEPYWITEGSLFASKQELIEAQIEYWTAQREPELIAGQPGTTGPLEYYPAFEGPIQGFNHDCTESKDYAQSNASKVLNNIHDSLQNWDLSKVKAAKFHDCTQSKDCDNEYEPGYCAHSGIKLDRPKIQEAPCEGIIPRDIIQRAVEFVSKKKTEECQHEPKERIAVHDNGNNGYWYTCKKCNKFYENTQSNHDI
jgi:hypothetical protein